MIEVLTQITPEWYLVIFTGGLLLVAILNFAHTVFKRRRDENKKRREAEDRNSNTEESESGPDPGDPDGH